MRARFYKGPFNGKAADSDGRTDIVITGPKKMTTKQKYDWFKKHNGIHAILPRVEARYRMIIQNGIPLRHPDGSIWYEYVEGSKREW